MGIGYLGSVFLIICKNSILFAQFFMIFFLLWSHMFTIIPKPVLWFGEDFGELPIECIFVFETEGETAEKENPQHGRPFILRV